MRKFTKWWESGRTFQRDLSGGDVKVVAKTEVLRQVVLCIIVDVCSLNGPT